MSIYNTPYGLDEPQWVESIYGSVYVPLRIRWTLRDKHRDYAMLTRYPPDTMWIGNMMPGAGKIEVAGTFTDLGQAKTELEIYGGDDEHACQCRL